MKRQQERFYEITFQLEASPSEIKEYTGKSHYPIRFEWLNTYKKTLEDAIRMTKQHIYNEIDVDNVIKVISINNAAINLYDNVSLSYAAIKRIKHITKKCNMSRKAISDARQLLNTNSDSVFCYNDCMDMPYAPQPYCFDLSMNSFKKLLYKDVLVFVSIDFDRLFQKIRNAGFKIYKKRPGNININHLLRIKDSYWYMENESEAGYVGDAMVERLVYGLYTSEDYIDFLTHI